MLIRIIEQDREAGLKEIEFITAKRPMQRKAAQKALIFADTQRCKSLKNFLEFEEIEDVVKAPLSRTEKLPETYTEALADMQEIYQEVTAFLSETNLYRKQQALTRTKAKIGNFQSDMMRSRGQYASWFQQVAEHWHTLAERETNKEATAEMVFREIANPFVSGNPIRPEFTNLLVGREDVFKLINRHLVGVSHKPTLLLYGRRRIGKTSTLLNLDKFLDSSLIPVYIDFQEPRYTKSPGEFCYNFYRVIYKRLSSYAPSYAPSFNMPSLTLDNFKETSFTKLEEALDKIEGTLAQENDTILLAIDEYEKLEETGVDKSLAEDILSQFRHTLQHRGNFALLFSGSHTIDELSRIRWSSYLINTKTIEIGFLPYVAAHKLITGPIPPEEGFDMVYKEDTDKKLLDITACQPYLVQALASDLVNLMNTKERREVYAADLNEAVDKVVTSADSYFSYIWTDDCRDDEREVLLKMARGEGVNTKDVSQKIKAGLRRKEIIKENEGVLDFKIDLMRRWIIKYQL